MFRSDLAALWTPPEWVRRWGESKDSNVEKMEEIKLHSK